jgi:short-subunit dehydrogenase
MLLLTGASRGIGAKLAFKLAELGYDLALVARNEVALELLKKELSLKYQRKIEIFPCDLSQSVAVHQLITALSTLEITGIIHNAGVDDFKAFDQQAFHDLESNLFLNLTAPMLITRALLPKLLAKKKGTVIAMSSLAGLFPTPYGAHYSAGKSGLWALIQALGIEYDGSGVRFISIHPGFVNGDGMHEAHKAIAGNAPIFMGGTTTQAVIDKVVCALESRHPAPMYIANRFSVLPLLLLTRMSPRLGRWLSIKLMKGYLARVAHVTDTSS